MSRQKQTVVSFRVDQHLAEMLNSLPDKSTFIREAILHRFHEPCPYCRGQGVLPKLLADWLSARMPTTSTVECSCCHYAYPRELVREHIPESGDQDFTCPHCREHGHQH